MDIKRDGKPYRTLGNMLKALREQNKQSVIEVSGAVEIEVATLERIEKGEQRPAEEILALLISFFDIKEDEATQLWSLAGYEDLKSQSQTIDLNLSQPIAMVMPMDPRVVYTDMVHVTVNNFGVVMNFLQGIGHNNQPLAVARIGMSKEHARSVLEILEKSLKQSDYHDKPKQLKPKQKSSESSDPK